MGSGVKEQGSHTYPKHPDMPPRGRSGFLSHPTPCFSYVLTGTQSYMTVVRRCPWTPMSEVSQDIAHTGRLTG